MARGERLEVPPLEPTTEAEVERNRISPRVGAGATRSPLDDPRDPGAQQQGFETVQPQRGDAPVLDDEPSDAVEGKADDLRSGLSHELEEVRGPSGRNALLQRRVPKRVGEALVGER